ncbi:MAG: hypothetical protein V5A38_02100 [Halolamina sp.]|uniref:hypothetical protein n=1 Tax=Halolamina sp. TaxID=1940283 RepID=UPI002FC3267C
MGRSRYAIVGGGLVGASVATSMSGARALEEPGPSDANADDGGTEAVRHHSGYLRSGR